MPSLIQVRTHFQRLVQALPVEPQNAELTALRDLAEGLRILSWALSDQLSDIQSEIERITRG